MTTAGIYISDTHIAISIRKDRKKTYRYRELDITDKVQCSSVLKSVVDMLPADLDCLCYEYLTKRYNSGQKDRSSTRKFLQEIADAVNNEYLEIEIVAGAQEHMMGLLGPVPDGEILEPVMAGRYADWAYEWAFKKFSDSLKDIEPIAMHQPDISRKVLCHVVYEDASRKKYRADKGKPRVYPKNRAKRKEKEQN